ncbi:MAG: hypothetical protein RBT51_14205 [Ectothiorhodospiraceae bacterium]|jgi:hypothetical protein|nr:hypothetical protein [Ectothiorhodospiraceae bacterium]
MAGVEDSLAYEDYEEAFDWKSQGIEASGKPLTARRSLERYLERKALRRKLEDALNDRAEPGDLDW